MRAAPYVYVAERYEETLAAYERLGFERVRAWDRGDDVRSALFRAGPAFVELVDGAATRSPASPAAGTAASGLGSSARRAG